MDIQEKINALMQEEAFRTAFEKVNAPEDVVSLFGNNEIEISEELAKELFEPLTAEGDELSEGALEAVAGGSEFGKFVGTAIGNGVGYAAGYVGARLAGRSKKKAKEYAKSAAKFTSEIGGALGDAIG